MKSTSRNDRADRSCSKPSASTDADVATWKNFAKPQVEIVNEWPEYWPRLAREIGTKRTADPAKVVAWVFNNAGTPPSMIDPAGVPSLGALRYLRLVQSSDTAYQKFLDNNWSKTMPDKREMEFQSRSQGDCSEQLELLRRFDQEFFNGANGSTDDATSEDSLK